jgi:hypothetical protein
MTTFTLTVANCINRICKTTSSSSVKSRRHDETTLSFAKVEFPQIGSLQQLASENVNGQLVEARLPVPFSD